MRKDKHRITYALRKKLESLLICPSSVKIMSVRNTSGNMSKEWNKVNYNE